VANQPDPNPARGFAPVTKGGFKLLPFPVRSTKVLPEPFQLVAGVAPGPYRPPGELASDQASVPETACVRVCDDPEGLGLVASDPRGEYRARRLPPSPIG
jgi:hypothetical protein